MTKLSLNFAILQTKRDLRKYAAFMIGDQIIPRGILFQWMLKSDTNSASEQTLWEEEYIKLILMSLNSEKYFG